MKHGGDIYTHGLLEGRTLIDFSSNINPTPVSRDFINHVDEALNNIRFYPDIQYRSLRAHICRYLSVCEQYFSSTKDHVEKSYIEHIEEENIIVGNGAAEILDLAISSIGSLTVVVPSFVEYEDFGKKHNLNINYCYLNEYMEYDYEDMLKKIQCTEGIIIGNPNNPNGCIVDSEKFIKVLRYCESNNKLVIIDEAFIEFIWDYNDSMIKYIETFSCILIVRAITKFYSMPGIRFGYGITKNKKFLEFVKKNQNPWSVNCFAEVAVKYALFDEDFIKRSLEWIYEERKYLYNKVKRVSFIEKIYESQGNYFLCKLKNIDSNNLCDKMLTEGILIRNCANYRGLDNKYIRIAIKDRKSNEELLRGLKEIENKLI